MYSVTRHDDLVDSDLRVIAGSSGKKVFVVEDFFRHSDTVTKILHSFPDCVLIVTSRTSIFDLRQDKIVHIIGEDYMEFDVNVLSTKDISALVRILDENGLWGDLSGRFEADKVRFVKKECHAELRLLLIKLFESPQFRNKLMDHFYNNLNDRIIRWLILVFFLDIAQIEPDLMILSEISGMDVLKESLTSQGEISREFVNRESGAIRVKSSILGQYILQHVFDPDLVLSTLISCAKKSEAAPITTIFSLKS